MSATPSNKDSWSQQSPILLSMCSSARVLVEPDHLKINYARKRVMARLEIGPHAAFNLDEAERRRCVATLGGRTAHLKAIHLHTPSEHDIDGQNAFGEAHLVHEFEVHSPDESSLLVLGIPFNAKGAVATGDSCQPKATTSLQFRHLGLPFSRWYRYEGSLTTGEKGKPFDEIVSWVVCAEPAALDLGSPTMGALMSCAHQHERKLHPINRRFVLRNFGH